MDLINDALEYHSHAIVHGGEDSNEMDEHWDSIRYFWRISQDEQRNCGRAFHRIRLAEIVYFTTALTPYSYDEPHAMVNWSHEEWECLVKKLMRLCQSCKRQDAASTVRTKEDENPKMHPRGRDPKLFGKNVKKVFDYIHINQTLTYIREPMENWRRSENRSRKQPHVKPSNLAKFW